MKTIEQAILDEFHLGQGTVHIDDLLDMFREEFPGEPFENLHAAMEILEAEGVIKLEGSSGYYHHLAEVRYTIRNILSEARYKKNRKQRRYVANTIQTNQGKYDPRNDRHRQMLAQDLYKNMTKAQQGFSTKGIRYLKEGEEIVWKKTFPNGMKLNVYTSVKTEVDPTQKSGKTFRFAPRAKGRVYFQIEYTIPAAYARVAGVPQGSQMYYSFSSTPVNRVGTFAQIIARINAGIEGLEDFGDRIKKAAAYFSKVAKGDESIEDVEAALTDALPGRQTMTQDI